MVRHPPDGSDEKAKIAAAIETAKSYMLAGDPAAVAIQDAAEEADLRFELLARRFELACGTPAEWLAKNKAAALTVAAAVAKNDAEDEVRRVALQLCHDVEKQAQTIRTQEQRDRESFFKIERKNLRTSLKSGLISADEAREWAAEMLARLRQPPGPQERFRPVAAAYSRQFHREVWTWRMCEDRFPALIAAMETAMRADRPLTCDEATTITGTSPPPLGADG